MIGDVRSYGITFQVQFNESDAWCNIGEAWPTQERAARCMNDCRNADRRRTKTKWRVVQVETLETVVTE